MARCTLGNTIAYCISSGRCKCENAELQARLDAEISKIIPTSVMLSDTERRRRIALETDLKCTGRNNAVYVVKVRGQLVISQEPKPMPFLRAFSGEHPSKHALAFIERVTGKSNANV